MEQEGRLYRHPLFSTICGITVFTIVISQLPSFDARGITSQIAMIAVIVLTIACMGTGKRIISFDGLKWFYHSSMIYIAFILIASFINPAYIKSGLFRPIIISTYMMLLGSWCGLNLNFNEVIKILKFYSIATLLLSLVVYYTALRGASLRSIAYAYDSKNSTALIMLTSVIINVFLVLNQDGKFTKIKYGVMGIIILLIMLMTKSRATIVCIPVIIAVVFLKRDINRNIKRLIILLTIVTVILLFTNGSVYDKLVNAILLNNHDINDIEAISSGRSLQWMNFFNDFRYYLLFGTGGTWRESMPLAALLSYGLFFGTLVIAMGIWPIHYCKKYLQNNNVFKLLTYMIAISYFINSLFEEQAPFGPGAKCFFLWFFIGIVTSISTFNEDFEVGAP